MSSHSGEIFAFCMIAAVVLCWILLAPVSCELDGPRARGLLEQEGVEDVKLDGYRYFGCGTGDSYTVGFEGTRRGSRVKGTVCCGWAKDCTVRYGE